MDKILAIIKREYLIRVRSKGFIIGTAISPLVMMSFVLVPFLVARGSGNGNYQLIVLDQTNDSALYERVEKQLTADNAKSDRYEVQHQVIDNANIAAQQRTLNQQLAEKKLAGYIVIPADVIERGKVEFHASNASGLSNSSRVRNALNTAVIEQRMALAGINPDRVSALSRNIQMETINEHGERERGQTVILAFALLMILYITILVYGITVMRGVMEEKQSRIIEVLLSSVKPFQLMLGKLVGIGLVALTQYVIWGTFAVVISSVAAAQAMTVSSVSLPKIPVSLMIFFALYFLMGYFLYATLYAMIGAIVSNEEDGQQMQMPITMTIVIPVAISSIVMRNPDSLSSIVLSLIPFFSPVLMFMRITIQPPPWWQISLSFVLLLSTIFGAVWLAAKIYRVGVLMYGKRPTLPELVKWLKYT